MKYDLNIERNRYSADLRAFKDNGNAKIITGVRRCGKSTIMEMCAAEFGKDANVIYIDMEAAENRSLKDGMDLIGYVDSMLDSKRRNILMIDEVQKIEGWGKAVRDIISKKKCDIYVTGSNSDMLSTDYSTEMGGRFNSIRAYTLSYGECIRFAEGFDLKMDTKEVFDRFMRIGGFPILWCNALDNRRAMQTVSDIVAVSINNDIAIRYGMRNTSHLVDVLRYVASTIGNYVSVTNLYNAMRSVGIEISKTAIYDYLSHLEAANLIIRAHVFDIRGKAIVTSKHKYYMTDLGIKNALLGYRNDDIPGHMENVIFTELLSRGYSVYVGDMDGREIDIVAEDGDNRIYIQACKEFGSDSTIEREFGNLEAIKDSFPKYVVLMDAGVYRGVSRNGIICCSLREFLTTEHFGTLPDA